MAIVLDKACGGCPPGAKCVNGQCQIREEDAQAAGLTGKMSGASCSKQLG